MAGVAQEPARIILGGSHSSRYRYDPAQVVELVDALDSKSSTERCVGSIPTLGTNSNHFKNQLRAPVYRARAWLAEYVSEMHEPARDFH